MLGTGTASTPGPSYYATRKKIYLIGKLHSRARFRMNNGGFDAKQRSIKVGVEVRSSERLRPDVEKTKGGRRRSRA